MIFLNLQNETAFCMIIDLDFRSFMPCQLEEL